MMLDAGCVPLFGAALRGAFGDRSIQRISWGTDTRTGNFAGCTHSKPPADQHPPLLCAALQRDRAV